MQGSSFAPTRGQLVSVALGNALEFYDFLVFTYFAIQIGKTFFPATDPINSLLAALATFGAGFLTRPLGAWAIGRYGDRVGRKPAMLLSFALIGASSLVVALIPSYASIGVAAPVMVIAARLVQGFALGGEVGPSTAYLAEAAPADRRGYYVSFQLAGQGAATFVAGIVGVILATLLDDGALTSYGWRIALGIGVLIVPIGLALRRTLPEPPSDPAAPIPLAHRDVVVTGFMILLSGTIGTYVLSYLTTYAQTALKMPPDISLGATVLVGFGNLAGALVGGWAADRWGRRRVTLWPLAFCALGSLPSFWIINAWPTEGVLYTVAFAMRFVLTFGVVGGLVFLAEGLPPRVRSGTLALVYAVAISVFGGTTQFVIAWLTKITGDPMAPAWYLLVAMLIGVAAAAFMRETHPRFARASAPS